MSDVSNAATSPARDHAGAAAVGAVVGVRGSVAEIRFPGRLPGLDHLVEVSTDGPADGAALEVVAHIDDTTVRAVALTPLRGLRRGDRPALLHHG